jgi:hypothetical protein
MINFVFVLISFALTYYISLWFSIFLVFFVINQIYRWYRYNGRPWRKIHYKGMLLAAAAAGYTNGQSQENMLIKLASLLRGSAIPFDISDEEIVAREFDRVKKLYDKASVKKYMILNKGSDPVKLDPLLDEAFKKIYTTDNKPLMIRMIIASAIEAFYSPDDRAEYVYEVITNNAK